MTNEEVLQKVNDYCSEKSYTSETLTDEFKAKFSDFFAKKYSAETTIDTDGVLEDLKFNINTAFSATSKGVTAKVQAFETKENEYKSKIQELTTKLASQGGGGKEVEIPQALQEKLDRLERFENEAREKDKFKEVIAAAKKGIRQDLHKSFEQYAQDFKVKLDEDTNEQAKKLTERFQSIFRETLGDIKPLTPRQTQTREDEVVDFYAERAKVKVKV